MHNTLGIPELTSMLLVGFIMHQSNWNFTIPCAQANLGVGNSTGDAFSRGGEFDLCLGGVGKIEK